MTLGLTIPNMTDSKALCWVLLCLVFFARCHCALSFLLSNGYVSVSTLRVIMLFVRLCWETLCWVFKANCCYSESNYGECHCVINHMRSVIYANANCHDALCSYHECHCAECPLCSVTLCWLSIPSVSWCWVVLCLMILSWMYLREMLLCWTLRQYLHRLYL